MATTSNALAKPTSATAIQIVASSCARVIKRLGVALEALAMVEVEATGEGQNQIWTQNSTLKPKACSNSLATLIASVEILSVDDGACDGAATEFCCGSFLWPLLYICAVHRPCLFFFATCSLISIGTMQPYCITSTAGGTQCTKPRTRTQAVGRSTPPNKWRPSAPWGPLPSSASPATTTPSTTRSGHTPARRRPSRDTVFKTVSRGVRLRYARGARDQIKRRLPVVLLLSLQAQYCNSTVRSYPLCCTQHSHHSCTGTMGELA